MKKAEFVARYATPTTMSREEFDEQYAILECFCNSPLCDGWAVVRNDPASIAEHLKFNGRKDPDASFKG